VAVGGHSGGVSEAVLGAEHGARRQEQLRRCQPIMVSTGASKKMYQARPRTVAFPKKARLLDAPVPTKL